MCACSSWNAPSVQLQKLLPTPPKHVRMRCARITLVYPKHSQCCWKSWAFLIIMWEAEIVSHVGRSGFSIGLSCPWFHSKDSLPVCSGIRGLLFALFTQLGLPEPHGCCPQLCFYFICNPLKAIASAGRWIIFCREAGGDGWDRLFLPLSLNSNLKRGNKISLNFNKLTINHLWKPPDEDMDRLGYEWEQLHFAVIARPC